MQDLFRMPSAKGMPHQRMELRLFLWYKWWSKRI